MTFFSLPLIPFTLVSALFFRNRFFAYAFPVLLVILKMIMTVPSVIYLFTTAALLIMTAVLRKVHKNEERVTIRQTLVFAVAGTLFYELMSNAGFFIIGGCCVGETRLVPMSFAGLVETYWNAMPFAALHLAKASALAIPVVMASSWLKEKSARWSFARQTA